jgi:hypothetical protein
VSRRGWIGVLATLGVAACATIVALVVSIARSAATASAAAASLSAASASAASSASGDGAPPVELEDLETGFVRSALPDGSAEDEARWVLARLVMRFRVYVNNQKGWAPGGICEFPKSSPPIPSSFSELKGGRYASTAAEWESAGFAGNFLGFRIPFPQRNQYRWDNESGVGVEAGHLTAVLDRDGDGVPDAEFAIKLTCEAPFRCIQEPMTKRMWH